MQTDIPFKNLKTFCEELLNEQTVFEAKVTKANATDNSNSIACIVLCQNILALAKKFGLNNSPVLEWFADCEKRNDFSDVTVYLYVIKTLFREINCAIEYQYIQHRVHSLYLEDTENNYNSKFSPETEFLPVADKEMESYYITAVNDIMRIKYDVSSDTLNKEKLLIFNRKIKDELMREEMINLEERLLMI